MQNYLYSSVLTVHLLVGLAIIGLVLMQHGKGADMGAAFGSGASGSLFGASGSANFLSRTTAILAVVFFLTSLGLSYMATSRTKPAGSVLDATHTQTQSQTLPGDSGVPPAVPSGTAESKAGDVPK
ncbi:preprotein translocase membrane subunit [Sterolibacterium denitrificans]|uniref:Protein-export membrane protein SecG n=1 Tax=Sterolibacterium denitrificans TaxID=157592 RepID=A0A7Z7HQA2_9PROT|nr:preprotein translocase subunit SecG [Sterolibacterium denitrificans]SMB24668.1 preprotein translocase membrane subunit [Sterolibacterium denitrificans]